jgi:reactive intermediate/imine deaminase
VSSRQVQAVLGGRASQAVRAGPYVFLSGQTAAAPSEPELSGDVPVYVVKRQTDVVLRNISILLDAAGSSIDRTVKLQAFHADLDNSALELAVRRQYFPTGPPASTGIEVGLLPRHALVQFDAIGAAGASQFEVITTDRAPRPLGPYSMAFRVEDLVFAAGVLASDFKTGVAPEARTIPGLPLFDSPIKKQTAFVLSNIREILEAAGTSLGHVVKAQVILTDINTFHGFEEVWREHFPTEAPARSVFAGGVIHPGCLVEIDVIASRPDTFGGRDVIETDRVPAPTIMESPAIRAADLVFVGGQLATDYVTGLAPEVRVDPHFPRYASPIRKQGEFVFQNLSSILEAAGTSLEHVVKLWTFLTDADHDLPGVVELLEEVFPAEPPAVTVIEVAHLIVPGCRIMVDGIAVMPDQPNADLGALSVTEL